ncbi:hypothetical protein FIC87_12495 [Eggerthella lenta]|uniref:Uncharacterized protein n=1 Tax=Eggerthella lenta TaxID=84112 RepID=A0A5C5BR77_EGGLN|nr:hypothetical protein [Eggerthella lenta]TNU89012.1 hypothetical protein FIC87_12495 [Eggerthella lenta]
MSHRRSAYVDDDELERAAGMFEIAAEGEDESVARCFYEGAACALRILNAYDIKTCDDLMTVFRRVAFDKTP